MAAQGRPQNIASGNLYSGINVLSLWAASMHSNYEVGLWGTYKQWQSVGAQVRKGAKAAPIVFYTNLEIENEETGEVETIPCAKPSRVFNLAQVEGYTHEHSELINEITPVEQAEAFITQTQARIHITGDRACYVPSEDCIYMPEQKRFKATATACATEHWYAILFHELTHWTGSAKRLERNLTGRFGDASYAMEELIAEMGSAFLCADLGISSEPRADHASYMTSWLKVLKKDPKAIFTAASAVQKAVTYLSKAP